MTNVGPVRGRKDDVAAVEKRKPMPKIFDLTEEATQEALSKHAPREAAPKGKDVVEMGKKLQEVEKVSTFRKAIPKALWWLAGVVAGIAAALVVVDPFFLLLLVLAALLAIGSEYIKYKNNEKQALIVAKEVAKKSAEMLESARTEQESLRSDLQKANEDFDAHLTTFMKDTQKYKDKNKDIRKAIQEGMSVLRELQQDKLKTEDLQRIKNKITLVNQALHRDLSSVIVVYVLA